MKHVKLKVYILPQILYNSLTSEKAGDALPIWDMHTFGMILGN